MCTLVCIYTRGWRGRDGFRTRSLGAQCRAVFQFEQTKQPVLIPIYKLIVSTTVSAMTK